MKMYELIRDIKGLRTKEASS